MDQLSDMTSDLQNVEDQIALMEELAREQAKLDAARAEVSLKIAQEQYAEFLRRKTMRSQKENEWLQAEALYLGPLAINDGRYRETPFVKSAKKRRPKYNIVGTKCDIAISALETTQFGAGDKNWSIRQSPKPEGQGDVITAASLMEATINDQLQRSEYGKEARLAMKDFVIKGTGIMKSPLNIGKPRKSWEDLGNGTMKPVYTSEFTPGAKRVDPWMFFPDPSATNPDDMDDTQQIHLWTPRQLKELMYNPGFDSEAVRRILTEKPKRGTEMEVPDNKDLTDNTEAWANRYIIIEGYRKMGMADVEAYLAGNLDKMPTTVDDSGEFVFCEVWTCQNEILRLEEPMLETCRKPPYEVAVWKQDPSSVFGFGAAITMADQQRVVEQMWHMLLDNSEVSSGPQVVINKALLEAADGDTSEIRGWKVWNVTDFDTKPSEAIYFFNPPNNQEQIQNVLNAARSFADEESGIPMIQGGFEGPGGEQSATGTAIQAQRGTAALFSKSTVWDDYITKSLIEKMYDWNMLFNPDPTVKGDFEIDVDSTTTALKQQIELSNLEKLSVEASQNPNTAEWVNMQELLRTRLQMMRISNTSIVKTADVVEQERQNKQEQPNPEMMKLEIESRLVAVKEAELQLKQAQLQYEQQAGQQREQWENEERMANTEARNFENQSDMYVAAAKRDVEMMKIASAEGLKLREIETKLQAVQLGQQLEKFKFGAGLEMDAAKIANTRAELQLKEDGKSGI